MSILDSTESWVERFCSYVDTSGECWVWTGSRHPRLGYGAFHSAPCATTKAHRIAYMLLCGEIPHGMFVCHSCDNPPCVRPDHLFLGTQLDNMRDASAKGRLAGGTALGERHGRSKLTTADVLTMRASYAAGEANFTELGAEYGVSKVAARKAVRRQTWKHV